MFSQVMRFLFPKVCLYCREVHAGKGLLCERCLTGLDLLETKGRCRGCFRELSHRCWECFKKPRAWRQMGVLFEEGSAGEVLLFDPDRYAKEIAAFFVIQYVQMKW